MASSLWGGRFEKEMDSMVKAYNASIFFDQRMYNEDIDGSIAHVTMLGKQGIVTEEEAKTIMAGLACGEPNILSWDILRNHVSAFVSCPAWVSARGMRMLGVPVKGDPTVISGESGAVGMGLIAALMETDEYQDLREAIGLDRFSQVLLFSTEGNTDPMKFRKVLWDGEYPTV